MVKGISRQVILVHSPDRKLFDQAIFILKDEAVEQGVTDDDLLKEAREAIRAGALKGKRPLRSDGPVWACGGAAATALIWLLTALI